MQIRERQYVDSYTSTRVGLTLGQWEYLFHNSHRYIGLELMAIVFSLSWALLMWSYVISYIRLSALLSFLLGLLMPPTEC